ncbi:DUF5625 family protein [Crenothrix polyspora]|uniref:DUF5625 domain-containing protein n=1 Tax=Crenothrix polyspora TaxID=360316 RepID=A0A1R4HB83_9GAMM|nr:DUF5625 family protein [Crenothrix polyspora]SJM93437.1 conserved hypothetical protein [Crenothrix polyspora]
MQTLTVKITMHAFNQSMQSAANKNTIIILILFICLTGCSFFTYKIIDTPIALHKAGNVIETDFKIEQDDKISLKLRFFVNDQPGDRNRLLDFLGREAGIGFSVPQTVTVPLKIKIIKYTDVKKSVILNKTYTTTGLVSSGETTLDRLIDKLSITSGNYRIRIETIKDFPQLIDTKVQFKLYYIRAPK